MKTIQQAKFLIVPALFALVIVLFLFVWPVAISQAAAPMDGDGKPTTGQQLFLPFIKDGRAPTNTMESPFALQLTTALERCTNLGVNQACLANGTATGFTRVGQTITISSGISFSVQSTAGDSAAWSILLLRLQAPGDETITQTLDVVAVGNVTLSVRHRLTATAGVPGMSVLHFVSQPVGEGTTRAPSGLIIENKTETELLNIEINGAGVTLGSTAFLQAQPAGEMSVSMRQGSAIVQASGAESLVVAGDQVKVALDQQGLATGAPSQAEDELDDLLVPLVSSEQETYEALVAKLQQALVQCRMAHNSQRVYRAFYFVRQLNTSELRRLMSQEVWDGLRATFQKCARFEVIFDSTISGNTAITWLDQLHSDGTFIQFDVDGNLVARATSGHKHLQVQMSAPACALQSISAPDGVFAVEGASLRIHYNTMKIAMELFPYMTLEQIPTGHFICPGGVPLNLPIEWNTMFLTLHPELWQARPIYILGSEHWKYTGRQIFAEAIFADRSVPFADGTLDSTSYVILRHAPVE